MLQKFRHTLELVRFSHSIFALPYALGVMLVAAHGLPPWQIIVKILIAMVSARTMAMAFNRWLDAEIDAKNPRTAKRHIPAGILSRHYVLGLTIAMGIIFVLTCLLINPLAFYLSPIALIILLGYSACKRLTYYTHFVLGLALGIAPVGAWIAVTGAFSWAPVWVCAAVMLWVGGFDMIYAIQDEAVDRHSNLHSMVVKLGVYKSVILASIVMVAMLPPLAAFGRITQLSALFYLALLGMLAVTATIIKRVWALYVTKTIPDSPAQGERLLMLNGLTGLVFLVGCFLSI